MSEYGDRTPAQEMLEWVKVVQEDFQLTDQEISILLLKLLSEFIDIADCQFQRIQRMPSKGIK